MKYGDLGKRFLAAVIDSFILSSIVVIPTIVVSLTWSVTWQAILTVISVAMPLINIVYYTVLEGGSWHATIGKKLMGLYVANGEGAGITYSQAILRYIGKILSSLALCIGYFMCIFNSEKQCLHDMIAKTYVLEGDAVAESLAPVLVCVSGPLAGAVYKVPNEGLMIGRDSVTCQVVIPPGQGNVSRNHCNVTYNPMSNMFIVSDRRSTHGTFLANGSRIDYSHPAALHSGGRFYVASSDNMFEVRN